MKKYIYPLLITVLLLAGAALRFYNLEGRTSFGWDQERDITIVSKIISTRKPVLSGPVAGGEGGFLLGPLYYYLLLPGAIISGGSPLSLSVTSVLIDLVTAFIIYLVISSLISRRSAVLAMTLWLGSWLIINNSLTSWNVSLIPLWTVLLIYVISHVKHLSSASWSTMLAILFGFSFHVHTSLIPIVPVVLLINHRSLKLLTRIDLLRAIFLFLLVFSPLIVFDLRHEFINFNLMQRFLSSQSLASPDSYTLVIQTIFKKIGQVFSNFLLGSPSSSLGIYIFLALLISPFMTKKYRFLNLNLSLISLFSILMLVIYRDPLFPEYYLNYLLVFATLLIAQFIELSLSSSRRLIFLATPLIFIMLMNANITNYRFQTKPFSLLNKRTILEDIYNWSNPVDLRLKLNPGMDFGFPYLIQSQGIIHDPNSPNVALIQESDQMAIESTEKARSIAIEEYAGALHFIGLNSGQD